MKRRSFIIAVIAVLCVTACEKSEILSLDNERYIYMAYPEKDNHVFNFSFVSTDLDVAQIALPVKFAGHQLESDLSFSLETDSSSTLTEGREYKLSELVFHKSYVQDTVWVTLYRTEKLKEEQLYLKIKLVTNENFYASYVGMLDAEVHVTDQIAIPDWWDSDVTDYFLGTYSDKKFELFYQHGYMGDYGSLDDSEKRYYALKFKYWLQENPQTEDDGVKMSVAILG